MSDVALSGESEEVGYSICHVISGIDVGGAENSLLSLCDGLTDRGFDVTVAYLKGDGELADEFREAGCEVVEIGLLTDDIDPLGFLRLLRHLRRRDYDLVHGHLFHGNVYGVTAATLAGVPHVVSSKHNDPPFWDQQPYKTIHDATLRRVEQVFPISDHVASYLLETANVDPGRVEVIRYGLDPAPFDAVDAETTAKTRAEFVDDEPLVGTVARLTDQKDLDTLLEAFATINEATDAHLAIVGRGEQREQLAELARDLGISDAVTFTGFRSDIPALMRAFDVFALPSRWEGFGVVFLEAMAAGTPVVATNTSAIPEVVADGETGFLQPPGDSAAFATAIERLLSNDSLREEMGRAGRSRLEAEFTVERMVDQMVSAYREVLSSR